MTIPILTFSVPALPVALGGAEALRIETTTLMPGGAIVTLTVRPMGGAYRVSDDGAARAALMALGVHELTSRDTQRGNEIADEQGLHYDDAGFSLHNVAADQVPAAIAYVADASRSWAEGALDARAKRIEQELAERTVSRLKAALPGLEVVVGRKLRGASSKQHRFDVVVSLSRSRFAVFETIMRKPTSIAAAHLKFFDLREAHADCRARPLSTIVPVGNPTISPWCNRSPATSVTSKPLGPTSKI